MQTHMEETLERDIRRIREYIREMSRLAEKALNDCIQAFADNNRKLAYAVILRDQYINEKEKEIDRLCLEFLVRQQPVARPLRFAYSAMKINLEIERVGDYAESIAYSLLKLRDYSVDAVKMEIIAMARLSCAMFADAVKAYLSEDEKLTRRNMESEDAVDTLRTQLNAILVALFNHKDITFETLEPLLCVVRRFERVADQARNICLESLYVCTGEYAKHPGAEAFRILFVDDANACLGPMAESVANAFNNPKFIFNSAGIDPKPVHPATVEYMRARGTDLSRTAPRALLHVPNLDFYQVFVFLSKEAHDAFPPVTRKVVMLDWFIDDPLAAVGGADAVKAAHAAACTALENNIKDLIEAVIGVDKK